MKRLTLLITIFILILASQAIAQDTISDGFFDDDYSLINRVGCLSVVDSLYYGGAYSSCQIGDSLSFRFYGDEFAIDASRDVNGGDVEICIDTVCSIASSYSLGLVLGEWLRFYGLALTEHDVTITPQTGVLNFDALFITFSSGAIHQVNINVSVPEVTPEATPEITYENFDLMDSEGTTQAARFYYEISVGESINASLLALLIMFSIFSLGLQLWKK